MTIRAGDLRHRISIEKRSTTQDAAGEPAATWDVWAERWAALQTAPGRELFASGERQARLPTVFRLRYVAGVVPSMRVVWDSRVFDIRSVELVKGIKNEMVLVTDELVEVTA